MVGTFKRISLIDVAMIRSGCRRVFGRTWAKPLTNKGDFVFRVNEALTPLPALAINCRRGFQVSAIRDQLSVVGNEKSAIGFAGFLIPYPGY
jgi:hypothetical protein